MFQKEGFFGRGRSTQNAGTRIQVMIQGKRNLRTFLTRMSYTAAGTAHAGTILRAVAKTTLSAAASASQAVINLTADPGSIAANDMLAIKKPDGSWHFGIVSSVATLAITLTANVPTGGFASGAQVIFFGVASDTDHAAHIFTLVASVVTNYPVVGDSVIACSPGVDEPLVFDSDNATNAGTLQHLGGFYSRAIGGY